MPTDLFDLIISKKGFNWDDPNIRNIDFHSSMALPQDKGITVSGYLDFNPGDVRKELVIAHGLPFTPWYIPFRKNNTTGREAILPEFWASEAGIEGFSVINTCIDATNIKFKVDFDPYNRGDAFNVFTRGVSDYWSTRYDNNEVFTVGREGSSGKDGAMRFQSVPVTGGESLVAANLYIYTAAKIGAPPNIIRFVTTGIDEDNTPSFNNPMGRPKTDANTITSRTVPYNIGDTVEVDVLSQINEIRSRGGWSSGNAMGFLMNEQDSSNDSLIRDFMPYPESFLRITRSGTLRLYFKAFILTEKIL